MSSKQPPTRRDSAPSDRFRRLITPDAPPPSESPPRPPDDAEAGTLPYTAEERARDEAGEPLTPPPPPLGAAGNHLPQRVPERDLSATRVTVGHYPHRPSGP